MATKLSKVLQKPTIVSIIGSTLRIAHPDISKNPRTYLGAPIAAAGTAMTVLDNNGFIDDDWWIAGEIGNAETEEDDINGTPTRGTALTVTNTLKFEHEINVPITKIYERGIKIYGAATDGGNGTLIASVDAITTPIADAVMIQWDKPFTEYTIQSTDTAYAYYYVQFTDGTTSSPASDYVLATGLATNTVMYIINQALDLTNTVLDDQNITLSQCVKWTNEAQQAITQFMFQDPQNNLYIHKDWDFETTESSAVTVSTNENEFSLSTLGMKYPNDKSVINVRLGKVGELEKITPQEMDIIYESKARTEVATQATAGQTSLVVDSNVEFDDSGTLYVDEDILTYTAKSGTTTFTGIPASGDGAITATHAVDAPVWQGVEPSLPEKYSVFSGTMTLSTPVESDYNGYPLKIKYFKALTALTEATDVTDVTFTNIMPKFVASKIEQRKGNTDQSVLYMQQFEKDLLNNAVADQVPTMDTLEYYKFGEP